MEAPDEQDVEDQQDVESRTWKLVKTKVDLLPLRAPIKEVLLEELRGCKDLWEQLLPLQDAKQVLLCLALKIGRSLSL
jgi:hypothetical protein